VLCFKETKKRINHCCEQHYIGKKGTTGFEFSPLPVALDAHRMAAVG
jgi:TRAP-type mannitol/chloroaromatic compound transport system substrate-binding protein